MTIPDSLTCTRCRQSKPLDCFARRMSGRHGREYACKDCTNAQAARRRASKRAEAQPKAASMPDNAKRCPTCQHVKTLDHFHRCSVRGRQALCKTCSAIATARYREANKDHLREIKRAWRSNPINAEKDRETRRRGMERHRERRIEAVNAYRVTPRAKKVRALRDLRRRLAKLTDPLEIARASALIARLEAEIASMPTLYQQRARMLEEAC